MPTPSHLVVEKMSEGADTNALDRPSVMQSFTDRVNKFWTQYRQLESRGNEVPAQLQDEYNRIMEKGGTIRATIEYVTNTYDAVAEWVSDVFGFSGTDVGLDGVMWRDGLNGNLGVVQFVPLAVIAASSTMIVKWLKDAYTMQRKLDEVQRLENKGYDSKRAAEIVDKTIGSKGLLNIGVSMKPLLLIGGAGAALWYASRKGWI